MPMIHSLTSPAPLFFLLIATSRLAPLSAISARTKGKKDVDENTSATAINAVAE
jgi:hypothetical protein